MTNEPTERQIISQSRGGGKTQFLINELKGKILKEKRMSYIFTPPNQREWGKKRLQREGLVVEESKDYPNILIVSLEQLSDGQ